MPEPDPAAPATPKTISMAGFLQSTPPDSQVSVSDLAQKGDFGAILRTPNISLHCESDYCHGEQRFQCEKSTVKSISEEWVFSFVTYVCRNCGKTRKIFAIAAKTTENYSGLAQKLGEIPVFGPNVPSRVITLIGEDRDIFLRGRRSENHGLGIGAFSYYRRVVENQKNRIIREMAKVAKRLGASAENLKLFDQALQETQFSTAIDKIKAATPTALLIDGHHNPLNLLHEALSDGIHARSDAECLELAKDIRLVLTDLAERMSEVLRNNAELDDAVSKLLKRSADKKKTLPANTEAEGKKNRP